MAAVAVGAALSVGAASVSAEPMDPALERLVLDPSCHDAAGRWNDSPPVRCLPDNTAFKRLVNQYAFAFAPTAMHSARTTGLSDFHVSIEAAYTNIDQGQSYWRAGTEGDRDKSSNRASPLNESPASLLQLYSAKIRKGFGFGLELTGTVGYMPKTSLISGGADVRLSLLEGFRDGLPGIFPDIAVGGGVRTVTGTPELQLTIASLDAQISKPLPLAGSAVLTPWVGYQYVWIFGDSGVVDLTPGTDAVGYCNYTGPNVPGNRAPNKDLYDGQPVCRGGSAGDFNNNAVFDRARLERQRLIVGVNYRYEVLMVGGQFITDLLRPEDAQTSDADKRALSGESRQWTLVLQAGAIF